MFKNYFKVVIRILTRNKIYSAVNIFGFSIGLACCIILFLFIRDELSYDKFHKNADKIYTFTGQYADSRSYFNATPIMLGLTMKEFFPEIEHYIRVYDFGKPTVQYKENIFKENMTFTDPQYFNIFSFKLLHGNPESVLVNDNSIVLTESKAEKYFGDENPVGRTLLISFGEKIKEFTVSGVSENIPHNSTVGYDFLANIKNLEYIYNPNFLKTWGENNTHTYLLLKKDASVENIKKRFPLFYKEYLTYLDEEARQKYGWKSKREAYIFHFVNLKDAYFNYAVSWGRSGDKFYSFLFSSLTLLILVISCINFTNLSIGRSSGRAVEICVRKVTGAHRQQLIKQFLSETIVFTCIAFITGIIVAYFFMHFFNNLANKNLNILNIFSLKSVLLFTILVIIIGTVSGFVPAFVMSAFKPVEILKNRLKIGGKNLFTKSLVVIQFSISIFLIISTLTMINQVDYLKTVNIGYNTKGLMEIDLQENGLESSRTLLNLFKNKVSAFSGIISTAGAYFAIDVTGAEINNKNFRLLYWNIYYDYIKTLGIKIKEGREFSPEKSADFNGVIVNEAFVDKFKIESPVGKTIRFSGMSPKEIIGVVKDYNYMTLKIQILPMALFLNDSRPINRMIIRFHPDKKNETVALLEKTWKEIRPEKQFIYSILEDKQKVSYKREEHQVLVYKFASGLAILISAMGILGLTAITVNRRTKEIGIRKIMGAEISKIMMMLTKETLILIFISNIIAWPATYFLVNNWLKGFPYRTNISILIFAAGSIIAFITGILTMSFHAIRAANTKPADTLKYE